MTVTAKTIDVTLSLAEQIELRKFLINPHQQIAVANEPLGITRIIINSLEAKGYIKQVSVKNGHTFYVLKEKAL